MRYTNLISGERYPTEQNAMRHAIVKGIKAIELNDYKLMKNVWNEYCNWYDGRFMCDRCINDDIGYCELKHYHISEEEKFSKYCFPSFIRNLKNNLKSMQAS